MTRWGSDVLERLPLLGDETVLDAGCGTGQVTEQLAERLPRGRVVALDGSPAMVEAARGRLARFGDRVDFVTADLDGTAAARRRKRRRDPLDGHVPLDRGSRRPCSGTWPGWCGRAGGSSPSAGARATSPGSGRRSTRRADGWEGPWNFASPEDTRRRLEAAGFVGDRDLAHRRAHVVRARTGVPRLPADGGPECARRAARARGAGRLPRRRDRAPPRIGDRLRAPEHRRDETGGGALASGPERLAVAGDHDVGARPGRGPVRASIAAWSSPSGSISGVRSPCHHRCVIA